MPKTQKKLKSIFSHGDHCKISNFGISGVTDTIKSKKKVQNGEKLGQNKKIDRKWQLNSG